MEKKRLRILLVFAVLFSGCATPTTYKISEDLVPEKVSFKLIDRRDESQKKSETMSYLLSSCWYGVFRIGDDQIVPDRLTVLAKELQDRLGRQLQDRTVIVFKFEIFNNALAASMKQTPLGAAAITGAGCEAAFPREENLRNVAAIVINFVIDVDGRKIEDKVVQTEPLGDDRITGPITSERVKRAVVRSTKRIADLAAQ